MLTITHEKVSPEADKGDPDDVQPSDWNKEHKIVYGALLKALENLTPAPDKGVYFVDANNAATFDLSSFVRGLLGSADATALAAAAGLLALAGGTMTGALNLASDPAAALQAATKQYVDNVASGLKVKPSVRAASTGNVDIASAPPSLDGVAGVPGDRWLLKDQSAPAENGAYVFASAGAPLTRAADFDEWADIPGALMLVEEGDDNEDSGWVSTANQGGTLGTDAIAFSQFFGSGLFQPSSDKLTTLAGLASVAHLVTLANLASVANLSALAGLTGVANSVPYFTGPGALALIGLGSAAWNLLQLDGAGRIPAVDGSLITGQKAAIQYVIDEGGVTLTTGIKGDLVVPFNCTITSVTLLADVIGNVVLDIWRDTYANYAPLDGDSITASDPPTIAGGNIKNNNSTLTGWSKSLNAGDILRFNIDSVSTIKRLLVCINVTKT